MRGARLALVPVDDAPCSWCGVRFAHDVRCYLARRVPPKGSASGTPSVKATGHPGPSSLEAYAAAQRAGETVGHEWARSNAQHPA